MGETAKIELLLSDVDGTLVTKDKVLTERARRAVLALADKGIQFTITSSRPPRGLSMLVEPLQLKLPIGGFNGGAVVQPDMTILETRMLDPRVARAAVELILAAGVDPWVFTSDEWLLLDATRPYVPLETRTVGFPPRRVDEFGTTIDRAIKIVGVSGDPDRMRRAEEALRQLGDLAAATRSQDYYLDVTHPEANKGGVADYFVRTLGIDPAAIMTIGDMANDVLMFRKSGFSVAMGNAPPGVKAQASATTDSNESDGFAKAVERFLLNEPGAPAGSA